MRRIAAVMLICVFACLATASADEARQHALAEELVNAMDMDKNLEQSYEIVKQMIPAQIEQMGVSESETSEEAKARMQAVIDFMAKEFSWENIKEEYISIYTATFTEEELAELVEFYKSPVGRRFTEKQPELMKRTMEVTQRRMKEIMPKIKKFVEDMEEKEAAKNKD